MTAVGAERTPWVERDTSILPLPPPAHFDFETYLSVFTYRYGSDEMRRLWSQKEFWLRFRDVEIANAESLMEVGVVTPEQVADLKANRDNLSVERIFQWERDREYGTGHDATAAVKEYAEVALVGGEVLGHGLTSEDRFSHAEMSQIKEGLTKIRRKLIKNLAAMAIKMEEYKDMPCNGMTHLQVAEPVTVGHRFSKYAQDMVIDIEFLDYINEVLKGKGIKGAVGTMAAQEQILQKTGLTPEEHEKRVMEKLGMEAVIVSDQAYPRKYLLLTSFVLTSIAQTMHKFAFDMQILQSHTLARFLNEEEKVKKAPLRCLISKTQLILRIFVR